MNKLDIFIALPLLYGAYKGFRNGFVHEVLIVVCLVIGIFCGYRIVNFITDFIETKYNYHSDMLKFYAFIWILIVMMIIIYFITKSTDSLLGLVGLRFINKLAGSIFGIAKWALIISLVLYMIAPFDKKDEIIPKDSKAKSQLYQPETKVALLLIPSMVVATKQIKGTVNKATDNKKK
jgi:membrane protein required for colicin V production